MVNSQVTSITPATHAPRHTPGGADPIDVEDFNIVKVPVPIEIFKEKVKENF